MRLGGRKLGRVVKAATDGRYYGAAWNMLSTFDRPFNTLRRYMTGRGHYPADFRLRTATGPLKLTAFSPDDLLTINEIFCRKDYTAVPDARVIVDFGSNIGISAAYFLATAPNAHVYLFEPFPQNCERLIHNLRPFEGRYTLRPVAVGFEDGEADFGWEPTGRYGGIGVGEHRSQGRTIKVPVVDSNAALREIAEQHGRIDLLKIDIETMEQALTKRIPPDLAAKIGTILVEQQFEQNPLPTTHRYSQSLSVARFVKTEQLPSDRL